MYQALPLPFLIREGRAWWQGYETAIDMFSDVDMDGQLINHSLWIIGASAGVPEALNQWLKSEMYWASLYWGDSYMKPMAFKMN